MTSKEVVLEFLLEKFTENEEAIENYTEYYERFKKECYKQYVERREEDRKHIQEEIAHVDQMSEMDCRVFLRMRDR